MVDGVKDSRDYVEAFRVEGLDLNCFRAGCQVMK